MKFTKQLKEDWLKALKSGEYTQGSGKLKIENSYCCLGVLCVVAGIDISEDGMDCMVEKERNGYEPFIKMGIPYCNLYEENDMNFEENGANQFKAVIPLIEAIEVEE